MHLPAEGFIEAFVQRAAAEPDRVFARFQGEKITFAALNRQSDTVAAWLRASGLAPGDRVAVMLRNSPATLAVLFGLAKCGAVWVPINVQLRETSLHYILEKSAPKTVIVESDLIPAVKGAFALGAPRCRMVVHGPGQADTRLEAVLAAEVAFREPCPKPDQTFAIMFTSGTTGKPKGVMVTHTMLRLSGEGAALITRVADAPKNVFLLWEPLYHIGGSQLLVLPIFHSVELAMLDRFSAGRFWAQAREYGATHIHYLGGILQILLKQPPSELDRDHEVRIAWGGGCAREVWEPFEKRFGVEIRECYGMTEASSITTYNAGGPVGSVGRAVPWLSFTIEDADGRPQPPGERGEIVVRAKRPGALFAGYFENPEATARALRNGALHTGDIGSLDHDGNLFFHGRASENLRCRGENVSAWEVEHVAASHPDVEDCAVIGVAAEIGEQDIKIFVKPKNGAAIMPEALSDWLGKRLASFQNPRYISIVEEFERTPSQRIMKHRLPAATDDCWDRLAERAGAASSHGATPDPSSLRGG